jgi:serine phosphatase RsbU (regulator of sigma subunit)
MPNPPATNLDGFLQRLERWVHERVHDVNTFWQRVTEGLELQDLWGQFKAEALVSYSLYSREVDWEALKGENETTRFLRVVRAFFWAMILKLSPARRVFLLFALVLSVLAFFDFHIQLGPGLKFEWSGQVCFLLAAASFIVLLALELADRVTMKRDLEIAREIQRHLVPAKPIQVPGYDMAFATRPANTVAGDYYDAFLRTPDSSRADSSRMVVAVADVAGKGVPAALVMATFQASLRTLALEPTSLPTLVQGVNRYACQHGVGVQRFITALIAEIDTTTGTLAYINAGHNLPILRRASGEIERLTAGGLPFGIKPDVQYECGSIRLCPGDLLVIFTDGVVEAFNARDEEFADQRVLDLFKSPPPGSASDMLLYLMRAVDEFVGPTRQHDDITCLVLQVGSAQRSNSST